MQKAITELPDKIQEIYKLSLAGETNESIAVQLDRRFRESLQKKGKQILKEKLQNLLMFLSVTL